MQKLMKALHKNEKGFTLVELMVVVVIIGILVAIAIPIFNTIQEGAANSAHEANARTFISAGQMAMASIGVPGENIVWDLEAPVDANGMPTDEDETKTPNVDYNAAEFLEDWPTIPAAATENPTLISTTDTFTADHTNYRVTITAAGNVEVTTY